MSDNQSNALQILAEEIAGYRRQFHENPQTAYEETFISDFVAGKLTEWGIPFERGYAKTGIVATIEGASTSSGKRIGLRADMDALDLVEKSGQPWASKTPGKMHGCGHDGHSAILLGTAKYLHDHNRFNGTVHLVFQPGEEGACGADKMINEGILKDYPVDAIYGLHNWPWIPRGKAGVRPGPIMASVDRFHITLKGKGGHGAYPQETIDPVVAGSALVQSLQQIVSRNVNPIQPAVLSVTNFQSGVGAFNVIPDEAKMSGTIRSFDPATQELIHTRMRDVCDGIARAYGVEIDLDIVKGARPTINDPQEAETVRHVLEEVLGPGNVDPDVEMSMGGEDFGAFLLEKPGCYFFLGQGEPDTPDSPHNRKLHHPGYDFNDAVIPTGISVFAAIVEKALPL